jgi:ankyrin repeat protein
MHGERGGSPVSGGRATPLLALLAPRYEGDPAYEASQNDQDFQNRQVDIAILLLAAGADPNLQDRRPYGDFPLMFAAQTDNYHAVKRLLLNGADPNMSADGFTQMCVTSSPSNALGYAVRNEATGVIQLLLEADADPLVGGFEHNPIRRAAQTGNPEVLGMLLDAYKPWLDDYREEWSAAMTQLIIAWSFAADEDDDDIDHPSIARRYCACFKLLVDVGATVERERVDEDHLILRVLETNDPDLGAWFFKQLTQTPQIYKGANNPIYYYGTYLSVDELKKLLKLGVELNATDHLGRTMLHYVVAQGLIDEYVFLLAAGAEKDIKDKAGKTPIDYADEYMLEDISELKR